MRARALESASRAVATPRADACHACPPAPALPPLSCRQRVDEAPFELAGDTKVALAAKRQGGSYPVPASVPALGRARVASGAPGIFAGTSFVLRGPFDSISSGDLESLVSLGGGRLVDAADDATLVLLSRKALKDDAKALRAMAAAAVGRVVDQTWLLDSVSIHARKELDEQYVVSAASGPGPAVGAGKARPAAR